MTTKITPIGTFLSPEPDEFLAVEIPSDLDPAQTTKAFEAFAAKRAADAAAESRKLREIFPVEDKTAETPDEEDKPDGG